jgi:hypothetical protein
MPAGRRTCHWDSVLYSWRSGPYLFFQALYFSGITFFTVGYGDLVPRSSVMKAVGVVEAGCGLGFLALVIGYLPVLYQLFARREAHVMLLDECAGSPPTATELLKRHADGHSLDALDFLLRGWGVWSSELLEKPYVPSDAGF